MISRNFEQLVRALRDATDLDYYFIERTLVDTIETIVQDEVEPLKKEIEQLRKELKASILGEQ